MDTELLAQKIARLQDRPGASAAALQELHRWLLAASEAERLRINPCQVARRTGLPIEPLVEELLYGVHAGLFDMHWNVRCPICYAPTERSGHLQHVRSTSYCRLCHQEFNVELLGFVEVTFSLNKEIDPLDLPLTELPLPFLDPRYQMTVPGRASASVEEELTEGRYQYLASPSLAEGILLCTGAPVAAPQRVRLELEELPGGAEFTTRGLEVRPGPVAIEFINRGPRASAFALVAAGHRGATLADLPEHLTGLELLHMPAFLHLFKGQAPSLRERLHIASVTVLFASLEGSTRIHERLGDIAAYRVMSQCLVLLFQAIQSAQGVVIKALGDAVMASFRDNASALQGILHALAALQQYNQDRPPEERMQLSIGLHRGAAILVNLNDQLDYFGSSINKAARLQGQAERGELVVSQTVFEDPVFQKALAGTQLGPSERFVGELKGITDRQVLYRIPVPLGG